MQTDLVALLTDPAAFFDDRADDPGVTGPLLTVGAVAAVGVVGAFAALVVQYTKFPDGMASLVAIGGVVAALVRGVVPVVVWLVYSAFFLAITALQDGEGEPRDTILLAGWGMAPRVLGAVAVSAGAVAANLLTPAPAGAGAEALQAYNQQVSSHPANLAAPLVKLAAFLWSGYVWVPAVERARNVTRKGAMVAVGVPLAIEILVTLGLLAITLLGAMAAP